MKKTMKTKKFEMENIHREHKYKSKVLKRTCKRCMIAVIITAIPGDMINHQKSPGMFRLKTTLIMQKVTV